MSDPQYPRAYRIASLVHESLAKIVGAECGGEWVTLRHVSLNRDCSVATVSFAVVDGGDGDGDASDAVGRRLAMKSAHFRRRLAATLNMRSTPRLDFVPDLRGFAADKVRAFLDTVPPGEEI